MSCCVNPNACSSPPAAAGDAGFALELEAEQGTHDPAEVLGGGVLEHHRLLRVRIAGDEQDVENPDRSLALELRELVDYPALEVRIAVKADADELNRAYLCHSSLRRLSAARQERRLLSIELRLAQDAALAQRREPLELAGTAAGPPGQVS